MAMQRVSAYHLILTAYGFWLPNDPRGSWSDFVRAFDLLQFGRATKVTTHRSVARTPHDHRMRAYAKNFMAREEIKFSGIQARAIARGFGEYVRKSGLEIRAAVVMPDHAHFVVMRHRYSIEQVGNLLKGAATRRLAQERLHPFANQEYRNGTLPSPWARKQWSVFLADADINRAIEYVRNNPVKAGLPPQHWQRSRA